MDYQSKILPNQKNVSQRIFTAIHAKYEIEHRRPFKMTLREKNASLKIKRKIIFVCQRASSRY